MKKTILLLMALAGAMAWTGCMKIEEELQEEKPEETAQEAAQGAPTYTLTIQAERDGGAQTKGLAIDGEEASTTLLQSVWKAGEEVKVYQEGSYIGTLIATPDGENAHLATLSGEINTSDITANSTTLTLLTPRSIWDYTGQVGKLLISDDATDSIEKKFHYTMATNVLVTSISGEINTSDITANSTTLTLLTPRSIWDYTGQVGKLLISDDATDSIEKKYHYTMATDVLVTGVSDFHVTTENARFTNQQSIYRLSFRYNDGVSKTPITTKSVTISSANGHLVQSQTVGGAATEGDISVTLGTATTDPFFVALRNGDETNAEVLTFTVVDDNGITYHGTKTIPAEYKPNGTFVSIKNASLTERLALTLSSTEVSTVL